MSIELVTGPANAGKALLLLDAVRAHAARGEQPLLVVPTEADELRYRRELAESGLVLGVRVERFEGLSTMIVERAGLGNNVIGWLARERVLALAATRELVGAHAGGSPAAAGPPAAGLGLARELGRLVGELKMRRIAPRGLRAALAGSQGAVSGLERLAAAYEVYEEVLGGLGRVDREQCLAGALDELRRRPPLWGRTPVLLYGFDSFTELQLDAIETLGSVVDAPVVVSLAYEPGRVAFADRAGTFERLRPAATRHTALPPRAEYYAPGSREALHHLERSLFGEATDRPHGGGALRLLEGGNPRAELELVAGEVRALLDEGVAAEQIAIVHRSPPSASALLSEVLEDFGIPYAFRGRVRFADTALGRGLIGLLRCAAGAGELGDLLAWMRAPGVIHQVSLVDRLEASARHRGAVSAEQARALWEAERWPLDRIARMSHAIAKGPVALTEALASELERLFNAPRRRMAGVLENDELPEAQALVAGRRALEELRELGRVSRELAPGAREIVEVLASLEYPSGERSRSGLVSVVDPLSLRARRVRMLFLCGMQEGVFPKPSRPQPLLGERDRRDLALSSGLALPGEPDMLAAERYLLYAIVSRPQERLTLSWHAADDDGMPLARSLFVEDVCELFSEELHASTRRRPAGAADWPGPGAPVGRIAARSGPSRSFGLGESGESLRGRGLGSHPIAPLSNERVLDELRSRALWSASGLEAWAACPVKWLVERWIRPNELEPRPEPIARGGLAHAALADTLKGLRARTGSSRLVPSKLALAKRILTQALAENEERFVLSVAPERIPGARKRLRVDLERYLEHFALMESPLEPTYLELEFGFEEAQLPPLDLGEGVFLRGRIDRIDIGAGGEAVVYDYKGGSAPASARWLSDRSLQVALYMSAVEHLLERRVVGGFYQPLTGRDIKARGVLDSESSVQLDCVRTDMLDRAEMHELLDLCRRAALDVVAQAREGALEPRPATCAYKGGCSYPAICRCER